VKPEDYVLLVRSGEKAFQAGRKTLKWGRGFYEEIAHNGKDKVGSVLLRDHQMRLWKVRVRRTGHRERYLKFDPENHDAQKFRASADSDKPHGYQSISEAEWMVFALFAEGGSDWEGRVEDADLHASVKTVLDRLAP
jgi:hypothetical protein